MARARLAGLALTLLIIGGSAAAQTTPPSSSPPAPSPAPNVLSAPAPLTTPIELTPQQRSQLYQAVIKEKEKVRTPPPADAVLTVGAQLPGSVELYLLPDAIAAELPTAAKQYKYTMWKDQVILVDPTNLKVVEIIRQ
jgi:hypothetical protein